MSNEEDPSLPPVEEPVSLEDNDVKEDTRTYAQKAKDIGMLYTVSDVPPLFLSIVLGIQHYLTMLGATVLIPLLITPAMGATIEQTAQVISTIFFVSGVNTLLQTTVGDRLPIVQGGSFSYLPATLSIIFNASLQAIEDDNDRFHETMRVLQGGIIIVGILQMAIGYSGAMVPMLRYIGPITIAPVVAAIGLSLYSAGFSNVATCFEVGLVQIAFTVLFSQYMKKINVFGLPIFALFPIVLAIAVTWSYAATLTAAGVWDDGSSCRTDGSRDIWENTPWIRIPYPGQWGAPRFESFAIVPMIGSMLAGMMESIGDYYSCANLSGAPPPTPGIIRYEGSLCFESMLVYIMSWCVF
jgi:nucleobase transporter 1/2